jgi:hypothetical protein
MVKKDLEFICAYAEVHDKSNVPFMTVYGEICNWIDAMGQYYDIPSEDVVDDFLDKYHSMKEYKLDAEIKECIKNGVSFYTACEEWDI